MVITWDDISKHLELIATNSSFAAIVIGGGLSLYKGWLISEEESREYKFATSAKNELLKELDDGVHIFKGAVGLEEVSHLRVWSSLLEGLK